MRRRYLLLAMLGARALLGQVDTGSVSGTVTDATSAGVPGATVRILHEETNQQTEVKTNESGFYSAPVLRSGRYSVLVDKSGFRPQRSRPFDLRVQDRVEIGFLLEVGPLSAEIAVSAVAALLESETSSLGQVIEGKAITDLPLNGRSFMQVATLGAGTLPSTRSVDRDSFISNGARSVQNSYLLDGIDNKNRVMGSDKSVAQVIQPVIESIQELKVQTSTFSAEFGQAAGGVVNVSLKSGTNHFRGSVFEFLRNSYLDATPYFQPLGGKSLFIQNQFGATLGGPVVKNRTFFFGSWQSSREVNAAPQIASVPAPALRQGRFPGRVTDVSTGAPFPDNTIPQIRWDPVSAKLLPLYPAPNLPGGVRNYYSNPRERVESGVYSARVDHRFSSGDNLFTRIAGSTGENHLPTVLPDPANQQNFIDLMARSMMLSETHTFAGNKLNEFRLGFAFSRLNQDVSGPRLFEQYGIRGAVDTAKIKGLPQFTITGLSSLGTTAPGNAPIPATGAPSGNYPSDKSGKIWQLLDNFSWVRSRHTLKFGADLERVTMFIYATNAARPNFTFNGTYTGNALGDFLLGYIYNTASSQQQVDTIQQHVYSGYVQDDWKVSSVLTVNLGLRYEMVTPFVEEFDRQSNFILDGGPCYLQLVTVAGRGHCGLPRALVFTDRNNFAPRLGLAYHAQDKTVLRSGFGVFHGRDENVGILRRLPNNPPFISSATFAGDQTNPAFLLRDGFPTNALSLTGGGIPDVNNFPLSFPTPYVIQWNINIERELTAHTILQVGYSGSQAHKLPGVVNVNQPFPGTGNLNARRPYRGYGTIQSYNPYINSNYHALIAKLERRFAKGMSMLASYTYSHSIDGGPNSNDMNDPGPQDARNLKALRGSSNFDVKHRFVLSGVYQLPHGSGVLAAVRRNWQLSGIFAAQTGQPFTPTLSTDPSGTNTTARPNRLRDGALPSAERGPSHWFDTTAFAAPACICFGNSGRNLLRGPGLVNLDLGIHRDFHLHESLLLQLRGEAFNLFNHPNFGLPVMAIGNPQAGIIGSVVNSERQIQLAVKLQF